MEIYRYIIKERLINKSSDFLYNLWTSKDGLNLFFSVDNNIEIKPLGKYEIFFSLEEPYGLRGSEGCQVLSYIPKQMFSFTWNNPPSLKDLRESGYHTWVVITFTEMEENETLMRFVNYGYPLDEKWDKSYQYFNRAWDYVLNNLTKVCEKKN